MSKIGSIFLKVKDILKGLNYHESDDIFGFNDRTVNVPEQWADRSFRVAVTGGPNREMSGGKFEKDVEMNVFLLYAAPAGNSSETWGDVYYNVLCETETIEDALYNVYNGVNEQLNYEGFESIDHPDFMMVKFRIIINYERSINAT